MRRPIKYKANTARRNRMLMIAGAAAAAVIIIGGTTTAVLLNRGEKNPDDIPVGGTPAVHDTTPQSSTPITDEKTSSVTTPTTDGTSEPIVTEPKETEPPVSDTEAPNTESSDSKETTQPQGSDINLTAKDTDSSSETPPVAAEVGTVTNYRGGFLALADYPTKGDLELAAKTLRDAGYTAVMIELKYDNGKLSYLSGLETAAAYGANPSVAAHSLTDIVTVLHDAGLYVTGRVCALRDDLAAKGDASAALMNASGFRYSDGASRWLSVYESAGQDYIIALLKEIKDAGVDEVVLRDFGLPADIGTTAPAYSESITKTDAVTSFIQRIDAEVPGLTLSLEMDALTVVNGKNDTAGIDVKKLSTLADSITADVTLSSLRMDMKIGNYTVKDPQMEPGLAVESVINALKEADDGTLHIRPLLEISADQTNTVQIDICKMNGYDAYQMIERVVRMTEK